MYKWFEVHDFRCFESLRLDDLGRVNVFTGRNNTGKTALLEALFLHCGGYNPALVVRINAIRGFQQIQVDPADWAAPPWNSVFRDFDLTRAIRIDGEDSSVGRRTVRVTSESPSGQEEEPTPSPEISEASSDPRLATTEVDRVIALEYSGQGKRGKSYIVAENGKLSTKPRPPSPPFATLFMSTRTRMGPDPERYSQLERANQQEHVLQGLRILEPKLKDIGLLMLGGEPVLHGEVGLSQRVPLALMGEGMTRLAELLVNIIGASGGVLLVDEIEVGLHHSVLESVWSAVSESCERFGTQLFATTHSLECILAAHSALGPGEESGLRVFRLDRRTDGVHIAAYDPEALQGSIDAGLEVR